MSVPADSLARVDALARVVSAREALACGDLEYADALLRDLELDLATPVATSPTPDRRPGGRQTGATP